MANGFGLEQIKKIAYRTAEKGTTEKTDKSDKSVLDYSAEISELGFDSDKARNLQAHELQKQENKSRQSTQKENDVMDR